MPVKPWRGVAPRLGHACPATVTGMSATAIRRRQRRAHLGRTSGEPVVLSRHSQRSMGCDMRVLYPGEVATPKIDRSAWAAVVAALIDQESGGNQTHFGLAVGVDRKTVARWLAGTVDVSEEKVRAVARALGQPARDLLVRVGYYQADELPAEDVPTPAETDAAIELVRNSNLSLSAKRELISHLMAQREEYRRQQLAEAQRLIELAGRRSRRSG